MHRTANGGNNGNGLHLQEGVPFDDGGSGASESTKGVDKDKSGAGATAKEEPEVVTNPKKEKKTKKKPSHPHGPYYHAVMKKEKAAGRSILLLHGTPHSVVRWWVLSTCMYMQMYVLNSPIYNMVTVF